MDHLANGLVYYIAFLFSTTVHEAAHAWAAAAGVFYPPDSAGFEVVVGADLGGAWPGITFMLSVLFSLNLMLACLNMIPLPPLDGSRASLMVGKGAERRLVHVVSENARLVD